MELIVNVKDKKKYDTIVQFLKSLNINFVTVSNETKLASKKGKFEALSLKTKGKSFTREEANER